MEQEVEEQVRVQPSAREQEVQVITQKTVAGLKYKEQIPIVVGEGGDRADGLVIVEWE